MNVLKDLGFSESEAQFALNRCHLDVEAAANFLLSLSEGERARLAAQVAICTEPLVPALGLQGFDQGPLKMVLCVRTDLHMGTGKMCAQCSHAAVALASEVCSHGKFKRWSEVWATRDSAAKIVLAVDSENELLRVAEAAVAQQLPFYVVRDAGRTQVTSGTRTVVGIGPAPAQLIDSITGRLVLL